MVLDGVEHHLLQRLELGFDLACMLHREFEHVQPRCHDDEPPHLQPDDGTHSVLDLASHVDAVHHSPLLDVPASDDPTLIDRHQQAILIKAIYGGYGDTILAHLDLPDLVVILVHLIQSPYQ